MSRVNPFADPNEAPAFAAKPKPTQSPVPTINVDQIAQDPGFPSRQARKTPEIAAKRPRRTYTTGRNQQINFKATPATIERFYRIADEKKLPLLRNPGTRARCLGALTTLKLPHKERYLLILGDHYIIIW